MNELLKNKDSLLFFLVSVLFSTLCHAQLQYDVPQEHYFRVAKFDLGVGEEATDIEGTAGGKAVVVTNLGMHLINSDGTPVAQYTSTFGAGSAQRAIPLADGAILFLPNNGTCPIETFDSTLHDQHIFASGDGSGGCNQQGKQLPDGKVLVLDSDLRRVTVYTSTNDVGTIFTQWPVNYSAGVKAASVRALAIIGSRIFITSSDGFADKTLEYDVNGNILSQNSCAIPYTTVEGLYYFGGIYDLHCNSVSMDSVSGAIIGKSGRYLFSAISQFNGYVDISEKGYRTTGSYFTQQIPTPVVISTVPRPGTSVVDTSYIVYDQDVASVTTAPLAFLGGTLDLSSAVRVATLVDGTATAVGSGVPTNTNLLFSWNAGTDLAGHGSFQPATIWMLANDGRGLIDVHFITIPANIPTSGQPVLKISDTPIRQSDMLWAWFWLIARNDSSITFSNGIVRDLSSNTLASGTTTTATGIAFLLNKLGVRQATQAEIARAVSGSTNTAAPGNQYQPLKRVGDNPIAVNEIGFDTGAAANCGADTVNCVWVAM